MWKFTELGKCKITLKENKVGNLHYLILRHTMKLQKSKQERDWYKYKQIY